MIKKLLFSLLFLSTISVFSQDIYMEDGQTTTTDTGTFYDPGDPDTGIQAGDFEHTICPETNGKLLVARFSEFVLGPATLTIYDGDSTGASQIGNILAVD